MNKVFTINLGGHLIAIEEPAYEHLNQYIQQLQSAFQSLEESDEIVEGIKERIAELFTKKINQGAVAINIDHVKEVAAIIGLPEDIAEEADIDIGQNNQEQEDEHIYEQASNGFGFKRKEKLTASASEKVIGGVCGGIANYYNIDPTLVRILALITLGYGGLGLIAYIVLWIALPVSYDVPAQWTKRIYRDVENRVIGGVCSGIARYFDISVVWIRLIVLLPLILAFVPTFIFTNRLILGSVISFPTMFILYIVLWIAIPAPKTKLQQMELESMGKSSDNFATAVKNVHTPPPFNQVDELNVIKDSKGMKPISWVIIGILGLIILSSLMGMFSIWPMNWLEKEYFYTSTVNYTYGNMMFWYIIPMFFLTVIPIYFIIYLIVWLIRDEKFKSKFWTILNILLGIIFVLSSIVLTYAFYLKLNS